MGSPKAILLACLTEAPPRGPSEIKKAVGTPEQLRQKIVEQVKQAETTGYIVEIKQVRADPDTFPVALQEIKEILRSKHWDGLIIGFGLRGWPKYTEFFEDLVNATIEITPRSRLCFNSTPDDLYETIVRNFGRNLD